MKKLLLSFTIIFAFNANSQECSELFISEYIEGPGNNNGIEIYNPTSNPIDLSQYTINRYGNGSQTASESWPLSGNINTGEVITIGNGQVDSVWVSTYWSLPVDPVFYANCALHGSGIYPTPFYFNGDDAMTLEKGANILDIFGKVGEDPGGAWTDDASAGYTDANGGTWWTKRQTLVRKSTIKQGVTQNPILFNPTLEWDSLPDATYSEMGAHSCGCATTAINENENVTYVMYPNPAVKGTSVTINSKSEIKIIEVINILGEKVLSLNSNLIPTNNLKKGTYIINIIFSDGKKIDNKLIIE
ncbi:MAG: lamin tail domain-containing protein [Flavobacteriales bacterium]